MKKLIILSIFLILFSFSKQSVYGQYATEQGDVQDIQDSTYYPEFDEQVSSQNPLIKSPIPSMSSIPLINRLQGTKWESINFAYQNPKTDPLRIQLIFDVRAFKYFLTVHRFFKGRQQITIKHLKTIRNLSTQSFEASPIVNNELRKVISIKLLAPNVLLFDDTYYFLR